MIKTLKNLFKQDKERFLIPNGVQDVIPIMLLDIVTSIIKLYHFGLTG